MAKLDNISIILKGTLYAGNIGQVARSMMNFGLKNLILVDPQCEFDDEAYARARNAAYIFENAPVYKTLDELVPEFQILAGTSRRGAYRLHMRLNPRLSAKEILYKYHHVKTGIIFGNEKSGLTNEDLEKCAWYITIPSHTKFKSLNLAHSVTVIAYELFQVFTGQEEDLYKEPAIRENVEELFNHMVRFLKAVDFPVRGSKQRTYADLKRILCSADLKRTDVNLLHGFMRYLEEKYMGGWLE